jgi:hypothetical protein
MNWANSVYRIFDVLRFPLVVLIVFLHLKGEPSDMKIDWCQFAPVDCFNFLRCFVSCVICNMAVPTYFLMSGYLFYNRVEKLSIKLYINKMKRRVKSLLIPYFFWISLFLTGNLFFIIRNSDYTNVWQAIMAYIGEHGFWHVFWDCNLMDIPVLIPIGFMQDNSAPLLVPMWFVRDLFVVSLFSPVLWLGVRKIGWLFASFLGFCYIFQFWPYLHGVSSVSFFFFTLGIFLCRHAERLDSFFRKTGRLMTLLSLLLSLILVYYTDIQHIFLPYFIRGYVVIATMSTLYIGYIAIRSKRAEVLQGLSKASFVIYAAHMVFISRYVRIFVNSLDSSNDVVPLFLQYITVPIMTIIICILIYMVIRRFCPRMMLFLNGGR